MRKILLLTVLLVSAVMARAQFNEAFEKNTASLLIKNSKDQLGLSAEEVNNLVVQTSYVIQGSDIRMAFAQQTYKGIPVHNSILSLAYRNGKLVSNAGEILRNMEDRTANHSGVASVQIADALRTALTNRNLKFGEIPASSKVQGNETKQDFGKMNIAFENVTGELLWLPVNGSKEIKLVWQFFVAPNKTSDMWLVRVDATTNQVVNVENLTISCNWDNKGHSIEEHISKKHFAPIVNSISAGNFVIKREAEKSRDWKYRPYVENSGSYRVVRYPAESPLHPGGTPQLHTDPWTWAPGNATTLKWHSDGVTDNNDTRGNNVLASEDLDGNNIPGLLAVSTTALPNLTFNFIPDFTVVPTQTAPVQNQQFNITNLFYWNNLIHDITYLYGFDEPGGNFQQNNLGRGGAGNDRVNADAQNPGNCNANFGTPADGASPRMQMFLCTNTTPARDGDADNAVIVHEYGHGISNRLTGGPLNVSCLNNAEQMGEGWSDYYGLMLTQDWATATPSDGFNNPRGIGTYLFGQAPNGPGIRPTRYSTNFAVNSTTYANLPGQAVPHGVGYVWCTMLWEMTWEIIQTAGINPNLFQVTPSITGGNNIALKLVQEGMRLQPCSPGFVQGRNAILRADTLFFGAQYSCAILRAFARRGLGLGASQGSSASITDGVPSFNSGGPGLALASNVTQQQVLNDIVYTKSVTANCQAISNFILTDTLPTHVTFVSATAGGTYNGGNRVVSWNPVNVAVNATQQYQFTVNINAGSYFPPSDLFNDPGNGPLPGTFTASTTNALANWVVSATQSRSAPTSYFVNNVTTVSDARLTTTAGYPLPGGPNAESRLTFWHWINSELNWDGGVVEISTNGGTTWSDLGPFMIQNGYNGGLNASGNPLGGRQAYTGNFAGFRETIIDLSSFGGQTAMFRFRFGSDASVGATGWFVDDIVLQTRAVVKMKSNLFNATNVLQAQANNTVEIIGACVVPTINTQPQNNILCNGGNASFSVSVTGSGLTYQWELSTDNGTTWNPIAGATTSVYGIAGATSALNGRLYRCVITGTCGNITSNSASIYVSPPLTHSGVAAVPPTVCVPAPSIISGTANGGTVSDITLASSGAINLGIPDNTPAGVNTALSLPPLSFSNAANLKVSLNINHTWVGDLKLTLTSPCGTTFVFDRPGVPASTVGNSNNLGTNNSGTPPPAVYVFDLAGATIIPETALGTGFIPAGSYQPSNTAGAAHTWAGLTFPCSAAGTWTLNLSDNAGGDAGTLVDWAIIIGGGYTHTLTGPGTIVQNPPSGANNQTGSFTVTNAPVGVNSYTLTSRDALGCSVSTNVTLTTSAPPVITVQPVARVICQGTSTTFNITATGLNLTYQWQLSTDIGVTWNNIPGATLNNVAVSGAALSQSGYQYRCIVTTACGSVTSNAVTLTVTPNPIHTTLTASPNPVCEPGPVNLSGTAVGGTLLGGADIVIASSGVINLAIPDAGAAVTNNITLPAFTFNAAANLKVRVNLAHTWVGDISVRLTNPCGNTIVFDRPGVPAGAFGNDANLSGIYIFDLNAGTIIPEAGGGVIPAGSYRPSDVAGAPHNWIGLTFPCSGAGTWTISLQDFVGGDVGTLTEWAIIGPSAVGQYSHSMTGPGTIVQNPSTGGPSNSTGNFTASNLTAGTLTYNLTTTDSRGCSVTSPINVTVNPRPNPVISPSLVNLCNGSSTILSVLDTTRVFNSTGGSITIPSSGTATPYPSTITTSGLPAAAQVLSVSLNGMNHTWTNDIDVVLQSPNGTNVILMSDVGGSNDLINHSYTFRDGFPAMSQTLLNASGTYRPTNFTTPDNFPAPGPGNLTQPTPTIASFNTPGAVVNGTWNLYVVDDVLGDQGNITSWSITFAVPGATTITYTWSPATGLSSTTGNPVTASPTLAQFPGGSVVYSVNAVSSLGCTSAAPGTATVNILALPAITAQPAPSTQIICPGFNVSYSVGATGAGLTYQWRRNGTPLVNGGRISGATSATVTITAVVAADAGTYDVIVSGTCPPAVTSNGAVLQIGTLPTITTQPPATTAVCERQSATIAVVATALPPTQIYQWQISTDGGTTYTNMVNTAAGSNPFYNNVFSATLTIGNAPLSISGNRYRCVITTNCGFQIISNTSQLTVNPTPVVTATPVTARVCISDTLVLLSGSPAGGVWSGAGVVPGTNQFLPYNSAIGTFPIKYKVTNSFGCSDSAIINIKVEECPERIRLLTDDGVLLYPNPNNGQFNIRVNSVLYNYLGMKVFTSHGSLVKQQRWSNLPYGRVIPIDIRDLAAGVYMVYIFYEDGVRTSEKTFKVIIPAH